MSESVMDRPQVSPSAHIYMSSDRAEERGEETKKESESCRQNKQITTCKYSSFYYLAKVAIVITFACALLGQQCYSMLQFSAVKSA